jgi:glutathione-regulated potassium-efflux system ancillary protein KefC
VEQNLEIIDVVKAHYPDVVIVARARDVTHWNQLRDRGVTLVQREMFESSLESARSVLEVLGQSTELARQMTQRFRQHNFELFEAMHPHYKDRAKLISVAKQGRQQLEEQMTREREEQKKTKTHSPS